MPQQHDREARIRAADNTHYLLALVVTYSNGVVTREGVTESLTNDGLNWWFRKLGHLCHLNSGLNKDTNTLDIVVNMIK